MRKNDARERLYTKAQLREIARAAKMELARRSLIDFTKYTNPLYIENWHHVSYAAKLDAFAAGRIKKLMVFMPPQHGKSELCSRRLPAKMLGDNPDLRAGLVSYNHKSDTRRWACGNVRRSGAQFRDVCREIAR